MAWRVFSFAVSSGLRFSNNPSSRAVAQRYTILQMYLLYCLCRIFQHAVVVCVGPIPFHQSGSLPSSCQGAPAPPKCAARHSPQRTRTKLQADAQTHSKWRQRQQPPPTSPQQQSKKRAQPDEGRGRPPAQPPHTRSPLTKLVRPPPSLTPPYLPPPPPSFSSSLPSCIDIASASARSASIGSALAAAAAGAGSSVWRGPGGVGARGGGSHRRSLQTGALGSLCEQEHS